jgi:hypothetical protein
MAVWAILAAPMIMSTALGDVKPEYRDILQNRAILAVSQDELGIQGRLVNNVSYSTLQDVKPLWKLRPSQVATHTILPGIFYELILHPLL